MIDQSLLGKLMSAGQLLAISKKKRKISEEVNLICFGQDSWQCSPGPNSDSIHLDFTVLRFNSNSIQVSFSCFQFNSKLTKKAELNWNRFWIWINYYISGLRKHQFVLIFNSRTVYKQILNPDFLRKVLCNGMLPGCT